ncbi:hypothetical protein ACFW04_002510 [Cataglyphis niger]
MEERKELNRRIKRLDEKMERLGNGDFGEREGNKIVNGGGGERRNKKRRAIEGMLLGIKKELKVEEVKVKKRNGLIEVALKVEGRKWNVIGVYVRGDLEKLEELNEWMERKKENGCILIGGNFNAKTGEEGGVISKGYEEKEGVGRRWRWEIDSGNIDSGHHPIIVRIKGDKIRLRRKERASKKWVWTREGKDEFRKALGNVEEVVGEVEEVWETMRDRIKQVMSGCSAKGIGRERGWWDSECKEEKSIVRKKLRRWREKGGDGKSYREAKGKYKKLIEGKKKEERER